MNTAKLISKMYECLETQECSLTGYIRDVHRAVYGQAIKDLTDILASEELETDLKKENEELKQTIIALSKKNPGEWLYTSPVPNTFSEGCCSVCGIDNKNLTGYVCNNISCPGRVTFTSNAGE